MKKASQSKSQGMGPSLRKGVLETPEIASIPSGYAAVLGELKRLIAEERLRAVLAVNSAMVLLYWEIGKTILGRQEREGWGAKVIDRLSADLRTAFPDMQGLSPRNLKNMRAFAAAWPDEAIVQQVVAQFPWATNIVLLNKVNDPNERLWYAQKTVENGWSRNVLVLQIEQELYHRASCKTSRNGVLVVSVGRENPCRWAFRIGFVQDFDRQLAVGGSERRKLPVWRIPPLFRIHRLDPIAPKPLLYRVRIAV